MRIWWTPRIARQSIIVSVSSRRLVGCVSWGVYVVRVNDWVTASERERERVSEHFSHSTVYDDGGSRRGVKLTWNWEKSQSQHQSQPSERASEQQEGKAEQNRAQSPGLHGRIVVVLVLVLVLVVVVVGVSI